MKKLTAVFALTILLFSKSHSQTTIVSENFENGLSFLVAFGATPVFNTGNSGVGDLPASSPFAVLGNYAGSKPLNDPLLLISPAIDVSGYSSIQLSLRLAAFSIGDLTNGLDNNDYIQIEISPNNGSNYYPTILVTGYNNAWWSYSGGTGVASTPYDGNSSIVTFAPAGGGERTTDGYSTINITNLPQVTQLRVRITVNYDSWVTPEKLVIDDFKITGTAVVGPLINVQQATLSGFSAVTGNISSEKTYQVRGSSLTGNIDINAPAGYQVSLTSGSGFGSSLTLTQSGGSVPWTTIYVRMNSATIGLNAGDIMHVSSGATTKNVSVTGSLLSLEPTVPSTVSFSGISGDAMTINFTGGNGLGRIVFMRASVAISSQPADGVDYNANSIFGFGDRIGAGQYIVYKGSGNSVTVTSLNPNVTYHVSVFEYNDNGTAAARNYLGTGGTGNATTTSLNEGLELGATNTLYKIDFDNAVPRVNNGSFAGVAANPSPASGELNSKAFSINQTLVTGSAIFGTTVSNGGGVSTGTALTGNFGAFELSPGNRGFAMQTGDPAGNGCMLMLRIQNNTGATITSFVLAYKFYAKNESAHISYLDLSHSVDNVAYGPLLTDTFMAAPDAIPTWKAYYRSYLFTNPIPNGQSYYIRWSTGDFNGELGSIDKLALDDIQIVANPTTVFPGISGNYENLVIHGRVQLDGNTTVSNSVTMIHTVDLGNYNMTIGGFAFGTSSGYLRTNGTGNVTMNNISTTRTVPVGNSTYNPITISNGSNLNWTVRVDDAVLNPGTGLDPTQAVQRTWTITPSTNPPPAGANIIFQYNDGNASQIGSNFNINQTVDVWHNDGFVWANAATGITPTGTPGSTRTVTLSNWTQFSPFIITNTSAALPVKFGEIKAEEINDKVRISWVNLTESNVLHYVIERSADGRTFNSIGQQVATKNNYGRADYSLMDLSPLTTPNFYRVVAIEFDGKKIYSQVVRIELKKSVPKVDVYPNPGKELFLRLWNLERGNYLLGVYTAAGQQVHKELMNHAGGSVTRPLNTSRLQKGVYILRLTNPERSYEVKLVVQ